MHELIILGGGPAGYVAAERAGEMGHKALLVERAPHLGGVCLNAGCIPTKTWLHSAKLYAHIRDADAFGVRVDGATLDFPAVRTRTQTVQNTLRQGVAGLMKKAGATVVQGEARLAGRAEGGFAVEIDGERHVGQRLLIAVGARPATPPIPGLSDNPRVVTSDGLLARETLPARLAVIGGGVIGLEFAAFHAMAGCAVAVVEMLPAVGGPALDAEAAKTLQRRLEDAGVVFHLGARVERVDGGTVHFIDKNGAAGSVEADVVLAAMGRVPAADGLGAESIGLAVERGAIPVDEFARTNVPDVYAAGDCTGRIQLAHYASRQATVAVRHMFGRDDRVREEAIPSVIYTDPEVAQVGLTEARAKAEGREVAVRKLPMGASGRYLAESNGGRAFVKAVLDARDGAVLGLTVVGPYAAEMIGAAVVMIETELRARDVSELVFPHPTVAELLRDVMG